MSSVSPFEYPTFEKYVPLHPQGNSTYWVTPKTRQLLEDTRLSIGVHDALLWSPITKDGRFTSAFIYWKEKNDQRAQPRFLVARAPLPNPSTICRGAVNVFYKNGARGSSRPASSAPGARAVRFQDIDSKNTWFASPSLLSGFSDGMLSHIEREYEPPESIDEGPLIPIGVLTNQTAFKLLLWGQHGAPLFWEEIHAENLDDVNPISADSLGIFMRKGRPFVRPPVRALGAQMMVETFEQHQRKIISYDLEGIL